MHDSPRPSEEIPPLGEQEMTDNPDDAVGAADVPIETRRAGRPWMKVAVVVGGLTMTAACAVVATLAATHKTAVDENAKAYAHGILDALDAVRNGYDPFES